MTFEQVFSHSTADTSQIDAWFDRVFDDTKEWILRYICIHIDDISSADDVFQDVYTSLYERIRRKGMNDIAEPAAFLTKTAKREIARSNHRSKGRSTVPADEGAALLPSRDPAPDDTVADRDRLRVIQKTVQAMPPLTSKVFILFYYLDMSLASIAEELGTTVDAVKSRLSRARREVRANLRWEDQ